MHTALIVRIMRFYAINVFAQIWCCVRPHGIENHIQALASGEFCNWHKVTVPRNQNDLFSKTLVSQVGDINSNLHVNPFLFDMEFKIVVRQGCYISTSRTDIFHYVWSKDVAYSNCRKASETQGDFTFGKQCLEEIF